MIAYDGTRFVGWQRQKNGRSVQQTLEQAFHQLLGKKLQVSGAGRTDSGVHAEGQVAHADIRSPMPLQIIQRGLNALLPEEVLVYSVQAVPARFHARYSARSKWYRYTLWNHPLRPLSERDRVHHVPTPLNIRAMKRAARLLEGRHDFHAFGSAGSTVSSTVRHLTKLSVRKDGEKILIDAHADGFLYHMLRRICGFLLEVGKGRVSSKEIPQLLKGKSRWIPPTAPAKGLCLMEVRYG